jgi:transcriptional regulator with XRE-family HTH domain
MSKKAEERYDQIRRVIAAGLASWRAEKGYTLREAADALGMDALRFQEALLGEWDPTLRDLARIEAHSEMTLFVTLRNNDE